MELVKFFTTTPFRHQEFSNLLERCGIETAAVVDGVILDREAFNAIPASHLPVWAWVNKADINSALHTRPATFRELRVAQTEELGIHSIGVYPVCNYGGYEFGMNAYETYIRTCNGEYISPWRECSIDYDREEPTLIDGELSIPVNMVMWIE